MELSGIFVQNNRLGLPTLGIGTPPPLTAIENSDPQLKAN